MRRWLTILTCLAFCFGISRSEAALQTDNTFEVRTTGNDNNGGCYDAGGTGTDYTQQNAAQLSLTDLAQTLSSTTLTSSTGGFTEAMVDNCIQITGAGSGAFKLGFYEITAYTNTNTVTIDRTACSTAGCSGGTGAVGGALATIQAAENGLLTNSKNVVYVKSGTYNELVTISGALGSSAEKIWFKGYNATRDDDPAFANSPVIDGQSTRANCVYFNSSNEDNYGFKNFVCQNATGDGVSGASGSNQHVFVNMKFASNGGDGIDGVGSIYAVNCEFASNTSDGGGATGNYIFSYSHDNGALGFDTGSKVGNIADTNSSDGILFIDTDNLINNVSYNNTGAGSDGFLNSAGSNNSRNANVNNLALSNGQNGFSTTGAGVTIYFDYNLSNSNSSNNYNSIENYGANNLTSAPSLNNPGSGDFTASSSSSPLIGAGLAQSIVGATGDYSWNIGVDQGDHASGGGASAHTFVGGF